MATFIATYDLKWSQTTPYSEFKEQAQKLGWASWILAGNRKWYKLPNTTLEGTFASMEAAEKAFLAIAGATAAATGRIVEVEKWIIAEYSSARFNSNEQRNA